jgi:hypothetical protein
VTDAEAEWIIVIRMADVFGFVPNVVIRSFRLFLDLTQTNRRLKNATENLGDNLGTVAWKNYTVLGNDIERCVLSNIAISIFPTNLYHDKKRQKMQFVISRSRVRVSQSVPERKPRYRKGFGVLFLLYLLIYQEKTSAIIHNCRSRG